MLTPYDFYIALNPYYVWVVYSLLIGTYSNQEEFEILQPSLFCLMITHTDGKGCLYNLVIGDGHRQEKVPVCEKYVSPLSPIS